MNGSLHDPTRSHPSLRALPFRYTHLLWAAGFLCWATAVRADWPQWRGPTAQGHAQARNLPLRWSESEHVTWKTPIPGRGWSSPVILGTEIWMTTALESEAAPEKVQKRLQTNTGDQPLTLLDSVEYRAVCVDRDSGRVLHDVSLFSMPEPQWVHTLNSYASPTPVIEPGRLYAHFGASGTVCLDTTSGKVLWRQSGLEIQHENGPGSSPILWKGLVIVEMDGSDLQYIVALDKNTGEVAWKTDRSGTLPDNPQLKKSYGTPLVLPLDGKPQLISTGANWLYSYDPDTGTENWRVPYETTGFSISARMVTAHGLGFFSTGFMRPEILAVHLADGTQPGIAWRYSRGVPTMASPIVIGDELYFVSDSGGLLTCLDARTGRERYRERLGGDHSASLLHADGKLFVSARDGTTAVIQPGPTFEVLARNQIDGRLMASIAVADNALFLRSDTHLYRVESEPGPSDTR